MKKFYKTTFTDFFELYPNQSSEIYDPPKEKLTKKGKVSKRQSRAGPQEVKQFATTELWMQNRERKIRSWFYNHTSKGRRRKARLKLNIGVGSVSKPRVLSEANLYSKRYYPTRVKAKVDEELKDIDDPDMRIAITKQCLHESWKSETQAIKSEIKDLRKKLLKEQKEEADLIERIFSGEQNPDDMEPEEYLLAQESIDEIVDEVLDLIATRTGWAVSLNIGGPDMSKVNGEITVKTYHVGLPKGKETFWTATPNYDEVHAKPFREWCRTLFAEPIRLRRAVQIEEKKVRDPVALVKAGRGQGRLTYVLGPDTPNELAARERRLAAEKARADGKALDGVVNVAADDGEDDDGDDESVQEADESETRKEGGGRKNEPEDEGKERGNEEMSWVHDENGIPVPAFVVKDLGGTKAPSKQDMGHEQHAPDSTLPDVQVDKMENQSQSGLQADQATTPSDPAAPPGAPNLLPQGSNHNLINYPFDPSPGHYGGVNYKTHSQLPTIGVQGPNGQTRWGEWGWNSTLGLSDFNTNWAGGGADGSYGRGSVAGAGGVDGFDASTRMGHVPVHVIDSQAQTPWSGQATNQSLDVGGLGYGGAVGGLGIWTNAGSWGQATPQGGMMGSQRVDFEASRARELTTTHDNPRHGPMLEKIPCSEEHGGGGEGSGQAEGKSGGGGAGAEVSKRAQPGEIVGRDKAVVCGGKEVVGRGKKLKKGAEETGEEEVRGGKRKQGKDAPSPKAKRLRHAPAATEFPEWTESAYCHLKLGTDHPLWLKLVEEWYSFEKAWASKGMSQSGRMPTAKRPLELGTWLPAPCQYDTIPKLPNVHTFADQWSDWWGAMQPECRKGGEGRLPKPLAKNMNVSSLKKGGALGLVVVLIGLRWWGTCEGLGDRWEQAVEDMEGVFRCFQE